jgi:predicted dehydrogenase
MKFGVIGTNFISDRFAEAVRLAYADGCDVAIEAIYSRNQDTGDAYADRHGIKKVYTNYDLMLNDAAIDAIYVASPTFLHAEHSIRAMQAGHDVLCEKMMAHTLDAFYEMKRVSDSCARVLVEAMRPDFDPALKIILDTLPKLGKIRRAHFEYCQYSSRYDRFLSGQILNALNPELYNSALADIGIYPLHLCVLLFGEPTELEAKSVFLHNGFEGAGTILMKYESMIASVAYSKITESVTPTVIEGELGSLTIDKINAPTRITLYERGKPCELIPFTPPENNMRDEVVAFMDIVKRRNHEKYLSVTEATQKCVDLAYRSASVKFH